VSKRESLRRTSAALGLLALGAVALTGCADTSDQSKVQWKQVESRKIVALDSTQSLFISGGRHSIDGKSQVDYRFAQKTRDGAIREDLVSNLMERVPGYSEGITDYVVDVYEDAEAKSAKLGVYDCEPAKPKGEDEDLSPAKLFGFSYNACATDDGEEIDYLVRIHVPKGTVDRSFGPETSSDSEEGSGEGSSSR